MTGSSKRRGWPRTVAINVGMVLFILFAAEVIFGGWVFGPRYGSLIIPKDFQRRFDTTRLYAGGGIVYYKRDEHGLRGAYDDPSKIDILAVGGSTTNELFIDDEQTWSAVLGEEFRRHGRPMVVVNAGVDGQSTIGHIKNFDLWFPLIPDLKARFILVYVGINDLLTMDQGYFAESDSLFAWSHHTKRFLMNTSALYGLFRNIRGMARARDARLTHASGSFNGLEWRQPPRPPDIAAAERKHAAKLSLYADRLRELAWRIQAFGARPIFVTQHRADYRVVDGRVLSPVMKDGTLHAGRYADMMAINRKTMQVCGELGAVCIDLASDLFFGENDTYDFFHTTPPASRRIGLYLYERLKDIVR
ncbi:MAG: GDSL-type esterase/lipase family protein [Rhodospirillales bacterium]|nr:GDSL-type esterase/lipase family protein [Rhodospirillales bacterium]